MDGEELEFTLLNKRDVLVYQIPPASSSAGHKADDWKKCIWRGRCRIAGKGHDMSIKMLDASTGKLFAQCVIPNGEHEKYVDSVIDSSRYFVLKISDGNRHAFVGLGFEDRNDAFDFKCTLNDFKSTWVDRDKQANEPLAPSEPTQDLSLKEGQKIKVNIAGLGEGRRKREQSTQETSGFIGLLAPPPSAGQSRRQVQQVGGLAAPPAPAAVAAPAPAAADDFGDFADFQSGGNTTAAASPAPALAFSQPMPAFQQPSAPAPAPAFAQPAAAPAQAPMPSLGALDAQFGQLSFGGFASPPATATPEVPPMQQAPAMVPAAFPPAQAGQAPKRGPFDEFDIFK